MNAELALDFVYFFQFPGQIAAEFFGNRRDGQIENFGDVVHGDAFGAHTCEEFLRDKLGFASGDVSDMGSSLGEWHGMILYLAKAQRILSQSAGDRRSSGKAAEYRSAALVASHVRI